MTFKIGDDIIMTADSKKGAIQHSFQNGNYKGTISSIDEDDLSIEATLLNGYKFWFDANGRCMGLPGMSIRPAKETARTITQPPGEIVVRSENIKIDTPFTVKFISNGSSDPTLSQWVEGQIPQNKPGLYAIWTVNNQPHIIKAFADGGGSMLTYQCWQNYTHYIPILNLLSSILPPPPPAKEVEAYGILKALEILLDNDIYPNSVISDKVSIARRFYSQPATAEVLNKYLDVKGKPGAWSPSELFRTLDQFIQWHKKAYEDETLFFTPAALDELGVK